MKTVKDVLHLSTEFLEKHQVRNSRRQAEEVLSNALNIGRMDLYMQIDRPLTDQELDLCRLVLQRRAKGEPPQYIHGQVDFFHCTFNVSPDVLIPRQETEILVDRIAKSIQETEGKELWDICCGSGCIGISLKKQFPQLKVVLSDFSSEALRIAEQNGEQNEAEIELLFGDLLTPYENRKADYVVCNPPYISEEEYPQLDREVRDFEPKMALVAGDNGLAFYCRLAKELPPYLNPGAMVWMEIGASQAGAIRQIFDSKDWVNVEIGQDWGGLDRFVSMRFSG